MWLFLTLPLSTFGFPLFEASSISLPRLAHSLHNLPLVARSVGPLCRAAAAGRQPRGFFCKFQRQMANRVGKNGVFPAARLRVWKSETGGSGMGRGFRDEEIWRS
jgi:hypothetical protein